MVKVSTSTVNSAPRTKSFCGGCAPKPVYKPAATTKKGYPNFVSEAVTPAKQKIKRSPRFVSDQKVKRIGGLAPKPVQKSVSKTHTKDFRNGVAPKPVKTAKRW